LGVLIGAAFGSFLNVVIYRLPRGMSLAQPPSHCPTCGHRLDALDLFPLLSFLLAGAKCRHCKAPISWRYFLVELLTGSLCGLFWYQCLVLSNDPVRFVALSAFAIVLVGATFIDLYHYIIPDSLNAALLLIGLAYGGWQLAHGGGWSELFGVHVPSTIVGALTGVAVFWGIAFLGRIAFRKDAMGHGDIKLARGIGAVLLPAAALASFGLAVALGAVLGILQILFRPKSGDGAGEDVEADEAAPEEPESIGSLLRCGLGYALAVDAIALFAPKFGSWWFGDEPGMEDSEDDWEPGFTHIPFGPYLALGAILTALLEPQILGGVQAYWRWATGK
jgi:leader peptidase (prepilin peptidase)/N-methyltransferase